VSARVRRASAVVVTAFVRKEQPAIAASASARSLLRTKLGSLVGSGDVAAFAFALAATVMPAVLAGVEDRALAASADEVAIR
jgi:hypothetical protein